MGPRGGEAQAAGQEQLGAPAGDVVVPVLLALVGVGVVVGFTRGAAVLERRLEVRRGSEAAPAT
mgnify:CR=1 FL=1